MSLLFSVDDARPSMPISVQPNDQASPVEDQQLDFSPKRVGEKHSALDRHLRAVVDLSTSLNNQKTKLKRGRDGSVSLSWAAKLANIPLSSVHYYPCVRQALLDLPLKHQFEDQQDAKVNCSDPYPRPEIDPRDTDRWLSCLRNSQAEVSADLIETAMGNLDDWDVDLALTSGRVPTYAGRPVANAVAKLRGLPIEVFSHAAVSTYLWTLARKHGVRSAAGGPKSKWDRSAMVRRVVTDETFSLKLRGGCFPELPSGIPCFTSATALCGVDESYVYKSWFRQHLINSQHHLKREGDLALPTGDELTLAIINAVLDRYEGEVESGFAMPPLSKSGMLHRDKLERRLGFVLGISNRFPTVAERMNAIADSYKENRRSLRDHEIERRRVAFIQNKIVALGDRMAAHGQVLPVNQAGRVSIRALESILHLKFKALGTHPLVVASIEDLVNRVGLAKQVIKGSRGREKSSVDLKVDQYCEHIIERGFGPPRNNLIGSTLSVPGISSEAGVSASELTEHHMSLLRNAAKLVRRRPGPVWQNGKRTHFVDLTVDKTSLVESRLSDPRFDDGLPANPCDPKRIDLVEIGQFLGLPPLQLQLVEVYRRILDTKLLQAGIADFQPADFPITFRELRRYGRGRSHRSAAERDNADREASKAVRLLERVMTAAGRGADDLVSDVLDHCPAVPITMKAEVRLWCTYLAELRLIHMSEERRERFAPRVPLATAIRHLCRARGCTVGSLANAGMPPSVLRWGNGEGHPSWQQQATLEALAKHLGTSENFLDQFMCSDWRTLGTPRGKKIDPRLSCHLPLDYWSLHEKEQAAALVDAAHWSVQNTEYSRRQRVLNLDKYRLKFKDWPTALKRELKALYKAKTGSSEATPRTYKLFKAATDQVRRSEFSSASKARLRAQFESFFGFLALSRDAGESDMMPATTRPELRDSRLAAAQSVKYVRAGGLGMPLEQLTFATIEFVDLVDAFVEFRRNRSLKYNDGTIGFINECQQLLRANGLLRKHILAGKADELLTWWKSDRADEVRAIVPPPASNTSDYDDSSPNTRQDCALAHYDAVFVELKKLRRANLNEDPSLGVPTNEFAKARKSFEPLMGVLRSPTPAAAYRVAIQGMVRNHPNKIPLQHFHVRDCLMVIILFQTYLRIKNIAQLVYKKDGTGQIYKSDGMWWIKIHRDRFKNRGGEYFRSGEWFCVALRDEDGLYSLIERWLNVSREAIRLSNPRRRTNADQSTTYDVSEEDSAFEIDVLGQLSADDDEEGDNFEDNHDDGQPDEVRFFIQSGGKQFKPSQLAARFKVVTARYLSESPQRGRGLKGLMPHGPHGIRHVGATDALVTTGSWEEAARVIQDAVSTVKRVYVHWGPEDQGASASETMAKSRARQPVFPEGTGLVLKRLDLDTKRSEATRKG